VSRIRTIKPEFWTSEQVMECSPMARLAFIGMWNFSDDQGVHPASVKTLKAEVFPGDDIASSSVGQLIAELVKNGLIVEFSAKDKFWWAITGWHHQLIKNPSSPKYPAPPIPSSRTVDHLEDSPSPTPVLPQSYPSPTPGEDPVREGKGREIVEERKKVKNKAHGSPGVDAEETDCAAGAAVRFGAAAFLIEHGASPETAADYLTLRRAKKAASTATALRSVLSESEKAGMSVQAVLETCCSRGWVGFKAEWVDGLKARDGPPKLPKFDPIAHINRNRTRTSETPNVIDITAERLA
jgi:hypothetical protein